MGKLQIFYCFQSPNFYSNLIDLAKIIFPAIVIGYLGYLYALSHLRKEEKYEFHERQLREFYSPILGCIEEIKAKSNVRLELFKLTDPAWKKIVSEHPTPFLESDKYFEPFQKQIFYNNRQFREELFPLFKKMFMIFSTNISLSNSSTREYYLELARFVEIWERWLKESIPSEVIKQLNHSENRLEPFYQDINLNMEEIRKEISGMGMGNVKGKSRIFKNIIFN
jgi:uncharacterized protein YozE (UPF0346 family)